MQFQKGGITIWYLLSPPKKDITPPAPKKSFSDRAPNRLTRTGHWLCAPYLKRIRKNRDEQVSDKCWWCGQYRMSRTHVFLKCSHPKLESARKAIWDRLDEDGKMRKRPTSLGQLLGKSKWEKPLVDWIIATRVGLVMRRVTTRLKRWREMMACWIISHRF
jgi:hypothetical protein